MLIKEKIEYYREYPDRGCVQICVTSQGQPKEIKITAMDSAHTHFGDLLKDVLVFSELLKWAYEQGQQNPGTPCVLKKDRLISEEF